MATLRRSPVKDEIMAQNESFQASLAVIASNLEASQQKLQANVQTVHQSGFFTYIIDIIEAVLDPGDAVRRRKKANKIYKDLIAERISQTRAVAELQALTSRQKGGWLMKKIKAIQAKRTPKA